MSLPAVDLVNKWLAMRLDSSFSLALQHWSRLLINPNSGKTRPPVLNFEVKVSRFFQPIGLDFHGQTQACAAERVLRPSGLFADTACRHCVQLAARGPNGRQRVNGAKV